MTIQYMENLAPGIELEVRVIPMRVYHLVLGLLEFKAQNPEIYWIHHQLTALRSPNCPEVADLPGGEDKPPPEGQKKPPECGEDTPAPAIQLLGVTTFGNLVAWDKVADPFSLQIGDFTSLMEAHVEITALSDEKSRHLRRRAQSRSVSCCRM
jgi:hypothetical protein